MEKIFFDNWESIVRTACLTVFGYFSMILLLRVSGKRTLSKMNAFDFVITVALGSTLASLSLNKDISLADGVVAFFLLISLQYCLTWLSVRMKKIRSLITSHPTLLFYRGEFLREAMRQQRITEEEVLHASRQHGFSTLENIEMVILEATGDLTMLEKSATGRLGTAKNMVREA